jgi:hypothetical protein
MAILLSLPAAVLVASGLVTLMRGPIPLGVVLVLAGMLVAPGAVSACSPAGWREESGDRDEH